MPRNDLGSGTFQEGSIFPGFFLLLAGHFQTESISKIENANTKKTALIGAWFKHVPLRFLGSEKMHDLQPIAKIKG